MVALKLMGGCSSSVYCSFGLTAATSLARGGHSLMKFKTMCVRTLLPLCYMLKINQNFIIFLESYKTNGIILCEFLNF
jgi:hypothetical protein